MGEESFSSSSSSSSPAESVLETPGQSLMATPAGSFRDADEGTPLAAVAEAFEELARSLRGGGGEEGGDGGLRLAPFVDACSLVSVLFGCLGFAFKFAEMEYVAKVNDLIEASKAYETLIHIIDHDIKNDSVRRQGSHSRNLRRVRLGLDLIRALFEQFLSTNECSLKDAASTAYGQVCAPFHNWAIRKTVSAGMYALPTREQLISRLNETDYSVQKEMQRYINASSPIIQYIDDLFLSRNIALDW
ncbi:ACD11 homolog protein-like [Ananas comosus]|uniref:ACD11 homolog protein-like n=1 Tax=Ananas comosus TaxID=4615 RepID=A0A6P5EQA9_ANACO|nr:ACD11 homolog protein-like [Ananas comosus]